MKSILNLAWKEIIQLWRDRILLLFVIIVPVSQLVLIAEATGGGIRKVRLAVWDQDRSSLSQQLIQTLDHSEAFRLVERPQSYQEVERMVHDGTVAAALIIPPDFSRNVMRPNATTTLSAIVDGTNAIVARYVFGDIQGAVNQVLSELFVSETGQRPNGIELRIEMAFNPTLSIRFSTLTAQLPFITYQVVLIIAAVGFVRERELGTMEQLVVTPIGRFDLMLGKGLVAFVVGMINYGLLYLMLVYGFNIPMRGSLVLFSALAILFIITEIGIGTLISIAAKSQQQAILIVFLLAILEVTFSGYLVPTENMPSFMQTLATVSPLQHFIAITRHVFLKGSDFTMMLDHIGVLVGLAIGSLSISSFMFSRLEF